MKFYYLLLFIFLVSSCSKDSDKKIATSIKIDKKVEVLKTKEEFSDFSFKMFRKPASILENINVLSTIEKPTKKLKIKETKINTVNNIENNPKKEIIKIEIKKEKEKTEPLYGIDKLKVESSAFFTTFNVTDLSNNTDGQIISKSNFDIKLSWIQDWREKGKKGFQSKLFIDYKKYIFIQPSGSPLSTSSIDLVKFGLGIDYDIFKNLKIAFETFYGQDLFFMSYKFDIANTYGLDINIDYNFLNYKNYNLGLSLGGGIAKVSKIDNSYNAKKITNLNGSLSIEKNNYKGEFTYITINKDTDYFAQTQNNMVFKVSKTWTF